MAATKRHRVEIEADRAFIFDALRKAGPHSKLVRVTEVLNDRRSAAAYQSALELGKSEDEARADSENAKLSRQAVAADIKIVQQRIRYSADSSAALLLDDQLGMCLKDIDATYDDDDSIREDLERSRGESKTVAKGPVDAQGGSKVTEIVRTTQETAARAALWNAIIRNRNHRMELRGEMRLLRFGRSQMDLAKQERQTFTQSVTNERNPVKARKAALAALGQEIDWLTKVEALDIGPTSQEIATMQRGRLALSTHRLKMIREFVDITEGSDDNSGFEFRVTEVSVSRNGDNAREVHEI